MKKLLMPLLLVPSIVFGAYPSYTDVTNIVNSLSNTNLALKVSTNDSRVLSFTNQGNVFGASYIDLLDGAAPYKRGRIFYDTNQETLVVYNDSSSVALNVGAENYVRVSNKSGATITNGSVVYISGSQGQLPTIALASCTNESKSSIVGMATMDITNNTIGYVTSQGIVNDLDTSAFSDGDVVYVGSAAGTVSTNIPSAPNYMVAVGVVLYSHSQHGKIFVNPVYQWVKLANIVDGSGIVVGAYRSTSTNYTISASDYTVGVSSNSVTLTLPTAVGISGKFFNLKNKNNGVVTINTTSGQTIDGNASGVLKLQKWDNLVVQSDGANWIIQ